MNSYWQQYQGSLAKALERAEVTSREGKPLDWAKALDTLCEWSASVRSAKGLIHFIGNGASACMASHMAVDWTKNAGVNALAYNDVAFLTAIGNDLGYDQLFAQPVAWFGKPGDLLATISSSGNSPNVLKAIAVARDKGLRVVTLSGMKPENGSRRAGDLNIYVPSWTYGITECSHQILLHAWLDCFMNVRDWDLSTPQVVVPPAR